MCQVCGHRFFPEQEAFGGIGHGEVDQGMEAADESLVQIVFEIGRQDEQARIIFHSLQKITDLLIRILVMGALDVRALAEQGVGLVEEQNPILGFRPFEDAFEVLLRLTDIFGNDLGQIDSIHIP